MTVPRVVIVGGGATGVELAGAAHRKTLSWAPALGGAGMATLHELQLRIPLDFAEHLERQLRDLARQSGRDFFLNDADHLRALIEAQFGPITRGPGH